MKEVVTVHDVADLIERILEGSSPEEECPIGELLSLKFYGDQEVANYAIHCLSHFLTDEDIRENDKEYEQILKMKLRDYVKELRALKVNL